MRTPRSGIPRGPDELANAGRDAGLVVPEAYGKRHGTRKVHVLALLLLVSLNGCSLMRSRPRVVAPAVLPAVDQLESVLNERAVSLSGMRSLAKLHYQDADESGSLRQVLIAQRPDRLRVEVLSILGTPLVLTSDGDSFRVYDTREATLYRGQPSRSLMLRYARVPLAVKDLIGLLLASPALPAGGSRDVSFDEDLGAVRFRVTRGDTVNSVWFSSDNLPIRAEQRNADDLEWLAEFEGYDGREPLAVAERVDLEFPSLQRRLELTLQSPEINPVVEDGLFSLPTPSGVKVIDLDRGAE